MNRIKYILLITAVSGINLFSQEVMLSSKEYPEHRLNPLRGKVYNKTYIQIKGNPFLKEEWVQGTLYLKNSDSVPGIMLKFDTYIQAPIVYIEEFKRRILPEPGLVSAFSFYSGNELRYFKKVNSDLGVKKVHSNYFLEVLHEGENASFYRLYLCTVLPLRVAEMPYIDEFNNEMSYYLYRNGMYETARLNRSYLKTKFPQYRKEIKQFIHTNNLRVKFEDDFAKVISFLDKLSVNPAAQQ